MMIRRSHIAKFADRIGVTRLITSVTRTPGTLVLCYHRIGDAASTDYDSDTFSATADEFYEQISYLKTTYGIVTLDEVLAGPSSWGKGVRVLLTFDDAYLDNYTTAYPILQSLGVQGTFLLPTAFVGSNLVPWWDSIAHMVARSPSNLIRVPSLTDAVLDRSLDGPAALTRLILRLYKNTNNPNPSTMMAEVSESSGVPLPVFAGRRRFFSWEEAREMLRGGMAMGAHSHSHSLMGGLSAERQKEEAIISARHIADNLHFQPRVFALPCGSSSPETAGVLAKAGYEMSLLTRRGLNCAARWDAMRVRRVQVGPDEPKESARLRMALMAGLSNYPSLVETL